MSSARGAANRNINSLKGLGEPLEKSEDSDTVVFAFGRFQPPTTGHRRVVEMLIEEAKERGADAFLFVSSTKNKNTYRASKTFKNIQKSGKFVSKNVNENPLSVDQKIYFLKKMYPRGVSIINTDQEKCRTPFEARARLKDMGYTKLVLIAGSDRVPGYQEKFPEIEVLSAGDRAKNTMSGTEMRKAAVAEDFDTFKGGVMVGEMIEKDAKDLMNMVREGLLYPPVEGGFRQTRRWRRRQRRSN